MYRTLNPWEDQEDMYHHGDKEQGLYQSDDTSGSKDLYHNEPFGKDDDPSESYHKMEEEKEEEKEDDTFSEEDDGVKKDYEGKPGEDERAAEQGDWDGPSKDITIDQIQETIDFPVKRTNQGKSKNDSLDDVETLIDDLSRKKRREVINLDR